MTPSNYVSTQTKQTSRHKTASKVISRAAVRFMFEAGWGVVRADGLEINKVQ